MQFEIENISTVQKKLKVVVPNDLVKNEINYLYNDLNRRVRISGFREGKNPRSLLEKKYAKQVEMDLINTVISKYSRKIIKERGYKVIGDFVLEDCKIDNDKQISYTVNIEIFPEIEVKDFSGLKFVKKIRKVSDKDVEQELKFLQERFSEFESSETDEIKDGDYVIVDYDLIIGKDSEKKEKIENQAVIVGSNYFGEKLEKGLIGLKKGEGKDIFDQGSSGEEVTFKVRVKEVKKKKLKELNDDFAKQVGKYNDLAELKNKIRSSLENIEQENGQINLDNDIVAKLVELNPFEVPETLIKSQVEMMSKREREGNPQEQIREDAIKILQTYLILEKIGEANAISISPEEVDEKIRNYAEKEQVDFEKYKEKVIAEKKLNVLQERLKEMKTLEFIKNKFEIKEEYWEGERELGGNPE